MIFALRHDLKFIILECKIFQTSQRYQKLALHVSYMLKHLQKAFVNVFEVNYGGKRVQPGIFNQKFKQSWPWIHHVS